MDNIILTKRLLAVADMVTPGNRVCDVGCDHGYVSIYLVKKGIAPKAIAMDVRTGPLSQAQKNIALYNVADKVETRLSDGLDKLSIGEADTVVIAGMGGPLMQDIIMAHLDVAKEMSELVLQPQSEIPEFRRFLKLMGFSVVDEDMVLEDGKYYPMMKVKPLSCCDYPSGDFTVEEIYGPKLIEKRHPVLLRYLDKKYEELNLIKKQILDNMDDSERMQKKLDEIENLIKLNCDARGRFH